MQDSTKRHSDVDRALGARSGFLASVFGGSTGGPDETVPQQFQPGGGVAGGGSGADAAGGPGAPARGGDALGAGGSIPRWLRTCAPPS